MSQKPHINSISGRHSQHILKQQDLACKYMTTAHKNSPTMLRSLCIIIFCLHGLTKAFAVALKMNNHYEWEGLEFGRQPLVLEEFSEEEE
jgi:hypothetical protein